VALNLEKTGQLSEKNQSSDVDFILESRQRYSEDSRDRRPQRHPLFLFRKYANLWKVSGKEGCLFQNNWS